VSVLWPVETKTENRTGLHDGIGKDNSRYMQIGTYIMHFGSRRQGDQIGRSFALSLDRFRKLQK
jgi:hypothetical protein